MKRLLLLVLVATLLSGGDAMGQTRRSKTPKNCKTRTEHRQKATAAKDKAQKAGPKEEPGSLFTPLVIPDDDDNNSQNKDLWVNEEGYKNPTKVCPDGTRVFVDEKQKTTTSYYPDGRKEIVNGDGTKSTYYPDGRIEMIDSLHTKTTIYPDGSVIEETPLPF